MKILLTGASGFLGRALTPKLIERGDVVLGLSRHPPEEDKNLIPLAGDVTKPNLGLGEVPKGIKAVYHLAAIHHLGNDRNGNIWETNVTGTKNVIQFCKDHNIEKLYFCSTAYTQGRNPYEKSKAECELLVSRSGIPHVTIFKPSVVMGTKENPYPGHFSQFAVLAIRVHHRAEVIRRKLEGTLRLPVLMPVLRFRGRPEGVLNMVSVDDVVSGIMRIKRRGRVWLTHPNPPTIKQLFDWISEFALLDMRMEVDFRPTPIELAFRRMASAFAPYANGDDFPSDLRCSPITKEFVQENIMRAFLTIDKG